MLSDTTIAAFKSSLRGQLITPGDSQYDEARKRRVGYELSLVLQGMWPVSCVNPSVLQNTSLRRWQPVSMDRGPNSGWRYYVNGVIGNRSAGAIKLSKDDQVEWRYTNDYKKDGQ